MARRWPRIALATATGSLSWAVGLYVVSEGATAAEGNLVVQAVLALLALDGMAARDLLPTIVGRRRANAVASAAMCGRIGDPILWQGDPGPTGGIPGGAEGQRKWPWRSGMQRHGTSFQRLVFSR